MTQSEPTFEKDIIKKLPIVTAQNSSSDSEVRLGSSHNASSNSPHYASGFICTTERKKGLANIDERWYYILDKWNNIFYTSRPSLARQAGVANKIRMTTIKIFLPWATWHYFTCYLGMRIAENARSFPYQSFRAHIWSGVEWPMLWRITQNSLHNEGIGKWVNWAPIIFR